jgi:hypothetical protein
LSKYVRRRRPSHHEMRIYSEGWLIMPHVRKLELPENLVRRLFGRPCNYRCCCRQRGVSKCKVRHLSADEPHVLECGHQPSDQYCVSGLHKCKIKHDPDRTSHDTGCTCAADQEAMRGMSTNESAWGDALNKAHQPPAANPLLDFWRALVDEANRDDRDQGK